MIDLNLNFRHKYDELMADQVKRRKDNRQELRRASDEEKYVHVSNRRKVQIILWRA